MIVLFLQDKQADLIIHGYVDDVMSRVMERLSITFPVVSPSSPGPS